MLILSKISTLWLTPGIIVYFVLLILLCVYSLFTCLDADNKGVDMSKYYYRWFYVVFLVISLIASLDCQNPSPGNRTNLVFFEVEDAMATNTLALKLPAEAIINHLNMDVNRKIAYKEAIGDGRYLVVFDQRITPEPSPRQ